MPQASPQMKKGKSLVNSSVNPYPTFTKCTKHEGETRWGHMDVHYTIFSICTSEVFHDKKWSPQNTFTWFSTHIDLLSDLLSSHFYPFTCNRQGRGRGPWPPTILAYWVGNLTSKTEMFPYRARKIKTDFTVKCLTLTENLVCGL